MWVLGIKQLTKAPKNAEFGGCGGVTGNQFRKTKLLCLDCLGADLVGDFTKQNLLGDILIGIPQRLKKEQTVVGPYPIVHSIQAGNQRNE